jgi:predicted CXXCH cytochrome family protein
MKTLRVSILASLLILGWIGSPAFGEPSDDDCLACHSDKDLKSSAGKALFVDEVKLKGAIHGQAEVGCVDCHADLKTVKDFPHAEKLKAVDCAACHDDAMAAVKTSVHGQPHTENAGVIVACKDCHGTHDIRPKDDSESSVYSINIPDTCERCHLNRVQTKRGAEFIERYNQSIHYRVLTKSGLSTSATCVTCHGDHDVRRVEDPDGRVARKNIIKTCGRCHAGIQKNYFEGVHGKDYVKGSADVPVCTDCHSEHAIQGPDDLNSVVYATRVAAVCTRCHDDESLARQYGFLTSRLKSYASSYHGTASKFGETRVANCASCHGFHDIRISSDPKSPIHPSNLSKTCGQCHPGAGANFAKGKVHVVEAKAESKGSYVAKVLYIIIIASMISVFLIFIAADLYRRAKKRGRS